MLNVGGTEIIIILAVILLMFGGAKIPELMRGVGKGVGELQKGLDESKRLLNDSIRSSDDESRPKPGA
jgi:sec-independent protein translocase protein TatA